MFTTTVVDPEVCAWSPIFYDKWMTLLYDQHCVLLCKWKNGMTIDQFAVDPEEDGGIIQFDFNDRYLCIFTAESLVSFDVHTAQLVSRYKLQATEKKHKPALKVDAAKLVVCTPEELQLWDLEAGNNSTTVGNSTTAGMVCLKKIPLSLQGCWYARSAPNVVIALDDTKLVVAYSSDILGIDLRPKQQTVIKYSRSSKRENKIQFHDAYISTPEPTGKATKHSPRMKKKKKKQKKYQKKKGYSATNAISATNAVPVIK